MKIREWRDYHFFLFLCVCYKLFDVSHGLFTGDNLLKETIRSDNGLNSEQCGGLVCVRSIGYL